LKSAFEKLQANCLRSLAKNCRNALSFDYDELFFQVFDHDFIVLSVIVFGVVVLALVANITHGLDCVECDGGRELRAKRDGIIRSGISGGWCIGQCDDLVVVYHFNAFLHHGAAVSLRASLVLQISPNDRPQQLQGDRSARGVEGTAEKEDYLHDLLFIGVGLRKQVQMFLDVDVMFAGEIGIGERFEVVEEGREVESGAFGC
jgi:hypothetical protein